MDVEGKDRDTAIKEAVKKGYAPTEIKGKKAPISTLQYSPLTQMAGKAQGFNDVNSLVQYIRALGGKDSVQDIQAKVASSMQYLTSKALISRSALMKIFTFLRDSHSKDPRSLAIINTIAPFIAMAKEESEDEELFGL